MEIKKINKRFFIVDEENNLVYTLPNFLRCALNNVSELKTIAERLKTEKYIDVIREFEMKLRDRIPQEKLKKCQNY